MTTLSSVILTIALLIFILPPLIWGIINFKKSKGESSFRWSRIHKLSWFLCIPFSILLVAIAVGVGFI